MSENLNDVMGSSNNLSKWNTPFNQIIKVLLLHQFLLAEEYIPQISGSMETEAVHKTRVGFRRIRTQLRILKPFFNKEILIYLRRESKFFGQLLGVVRDFDVFRLEFETFYSENQTNINFEHNLWNPIFRESYLSGKRNLIAALNSQRYQDYSNYYKVVCQEKDMGISNLETWTKTDSNLVAEFITSCLTNQSQFIQERKDQLLQNSDDNNFHKLRIEVKRFRYLLDFFYPLLKPDPTQSLIQSLTFLQDHLGRINDLATAQEFVASFLQPPEQNIFYFSSILNDFNHHIQSEKIMLQNTLEQTWNPYQKSNPQGLILEAIG